MEITGNQRDLSFGLPADPAAANGGCIGDPASSHAAFLPGAQLQSERPHQFRLHDAVEQLLREGPAPSLRTFLSNSPKLQLRLLPQLLARLHFDAAQFPVHRKRTHAQSHVLRLGKVLHCRRCIIA